ncbi:UNVERIFIED_CONTAM: hypothetical protein FKN15_043499 [Acipenser sinensis]
MQRPALPLIHSECARCLASRVRCCAMRRRSPCRFLIPHPWESQNELAPSKLCDSSCAPSGSTLTG